MNRKDRRARRAQERKARRTGDTMGASYSTGPLPASVTEHPAFKAGQKVTDEQLAQAPAEIRAQLEDMQAMLRHARYQGKRKGPSVDA